MCNKEQIKNFMFITNTLTRWLQLSISNLKAAYHIKNLKNCHVHNTIWPHRQWQRKKSFIALTPGLN